MANFPPRKASHNSGNASIGVVTRMTRKAWGLSVVPLVIVSYLISITVHYNRVFAMADSSRWLFIVPPIAVCIAILTAMAIVAKRLLGIRITLSPTHLSYEGHTEEEQLAVAWKSLIYTPPSGQNMIRNLQVASKEKSVSIYDIFTPQFDLLCKEVAKRKTNSVSADSTGNLVIDSGRLGKV